MKFVYQGQYKEFMGRTFWYGKPTEVTDLATIKALEKRKDFVKLEQEEKMEVNGSKASPIPDVCPKCGKTVKRGKFMHAKHCKGPK